MRQTILKSSILIALALWAVGPTVAEPPPWIEPELAGRLTPCCDNGLNAYPPAKSVVPHEMPDHYLHPPEELERRKAAAFAGTDLPAGRRLIDLGAAKSAGPVPQALAVRSQFEGLNILQAGFAFPPDTMVAASATRVLEATNVALRLSNRNGGNAVTRSLENFFGLPTGTSFHFDPKVYFDRLSERFYVATLNIDFDKRKSFIFVSVSRGPTPDDLVSPDGWCNYRLQSRVGFSWADFPGLGMNENWLAVTVNNFSFNGPFNSVFVYALDKRRLAANAASCPEVGFFRYKAAQDADGQVAFTLQPAQHYSTNSLGGTPLFFVSSDVTFEVSRAYTLWRLVERPGDKPGLRRDSTPGSATYTIPPNAPQRGGSELDTGDQRMQQAAYRDGVVWAVHATGCNFGLTPGESCVKVVGITPDDEGGRVTFEETFGGGDSWFVWMPGVAVNARGDVAVAFQRSRHSMSAGTAFAGKGAASSTFEALRKLVNGRCGLDNFDGQRNRTGDYVGIQTDPADDLSFWIAGEYTGNVGRLGCNWRTRVARIGF